jgi:inner membrane protein
VDTLTHALSAALLSRATAPAQPRPGAPSLRQRVAAGFIAGAFPDCDIALRAVDTLWYLGKAHQGITHSLLLAPMWALVLAFVLGRLCGKRWHAFYGPATLGIAMHIAGDVITAYGTQLFAPLADWRAALSLAYVIDPYFTGIIAAGLVAAWLLPSRGRAAALLGLFALAGYVALLVALHQRAADIGARYAQTLGLVGATPHPLPQPFSPFHWKVIVSHGETYHEALVDLLPGPSLVERMPGMGHFAFMSSAYSPAPRWRMHPRFGSDAQEKALAREAWGQDAFRDFRAFARFPVLYRIDGDGEARCVWFVDLRFTLPDRAPSFVFGQCRERAGAPWRLARQRGPLWID